MDVIQVLDRVGTIFNLAKVKTVPCIGAAALSLFRTASKQLDSLAYIESITDAYRQYFVNDKSIPKTIDRVKVQTSTCSYHLNKLLSASAWSSISYQIILQKELPDDVTRNVVLFSSSRKDLSNYS